MVRRTALLLEPESVLYTSSPVMLRGLSGCETPQVHADKNEAEKVCAVCNEAHSNLENGKM